MAEPEALVRLMHKTIAGVTDDLDRFRFNTAISKLQVLTNEMRSALDAGGGALGAVAGARADARAVRPVRRRGALAGRSRRAVVGAPVDAGPTFDPALVVESTVTMIFQVDGKLRDKAEVSADIDEDGALALARGSEKVAAAIDGREVVKEIVRAPKLVNLVTKR